MLRHVASAAHDDRRIEPTSEDEVFVVTSSPQAVLDVFSVFITSAEAHKNVPNFVEDIQMTSCDSRH